MQFDKNPYNNWMDQAKYTVKSAKNDQNNKDFSWCCFKCQQAVEFGLKGLIYGFGMPGFGHSLRKLAEIVSTTYNDLTFDIICLSELDRFYIPTRYADAYADGSPFVHYTDKDASLALNCAETILHQIEELVNQRLNQKPKKSKTKQ